ncbi:uncharacterized protein [Haliotis asinina]|uniref:uncharacterized protein n=1 Tax=Haliotis asinina TaxID=109174 RepID=UPI003532382C
MESSWMNASVKNIRRQRQLELELVDIERRWHIELKDITRQRLGIIYDLDRYKRLRRAADYTSDDLSGQELRKYTRVCQDKMIEQRNSRRRARKFDFSGDRVERMNLQLPPIDVKTCPEKEPEMECVTYSDLNRQRASFQKGASDLNQYLMRIVRRKNRYKSDDEDDEEEDDDSDDEVDTPRDSSRSPWSLSRQNSLTADTTLQGRRSVTPHLLPPIMETPCHTGIRDVR